MSRSEEMYGLRYMLKLETCLMSNYKNLKVEDDSYFIIQSLLNNAKFNLTREIKLCLFKK